jgi:hypothetical protein
VMAFCGLVCGSECVERRNKAYKCVHEMGVAGSAGYVYRCHSPSAV